MKRQFRIAQWIQICAKVYIWTEKSKLDLRILYANIHTAKTEQLELQLSYVKKQMQKRAYVHLCLIKRISQALK